MMGQSRVVEAGMTAENGLTAIGTLRDLMFQFASHRKQLGRAKVYGGVRTEDGVVIFVDGTPLHQQQVFDWGCSNAGANHLALAILLDYFGDDEKVANVYEDFVFKIIMKMPEPGWLLTGEAIDSALVPASPEAN